MDNTHNRWGRGGGHGSAAARPPRESAHLNGRKGITSQAETKGRGWCWRCCLPPRHRSLVPSPAPRCDGAWRATCNRPPLFSLACPRARRESSLPYKFADTDGGRERPREDDARRGSDSPEMVASLDHGEVAINGETGVPFVLLTKLRARASARIAC